MSQAASAQLPNRQAMRKLIQRKRNAANRAPENPRCIEDLEFPEEYKVHKPTPETEENFYIADQEINQERIIIFGRETWLEHLATSTIWYVDGTFAIAPQLFHQEYVILVKKFDGVHPILYALLQNKQRSTYVKMLEIIKEKVPNARPNIINCDFEHAILTTMKDGFPNVQIRGCLFHLLQNLIKQNESMGHMISYNTNADFALQVKMILALKYVPLNNPDRHVEALASHLREELVPLLNWFEDNYIGRPNRRGIGKRASLFPTDIWNMFERTLQGEDRTNNHAEAAKRRLHTELGMLHRTIWNFFRCAEKGPKRT
ncbi:uncharacterized protein [Palaemon carinicauda]|uniref:uncharacterized protein n=1 Tax=Palaemon carinicauda TaxID=392227 RepID=UPI0035B5EF41